jgi:hypothetical protein
VPERAVRVEQPQPSPLYVALGRLLQRAESWARSRGLARARAVTWLTWAVVSAIGVLLLVGPVINKPLEFEDITSSASSALETWVARSFDAEYTVVRADDGRMRMDVVERVEAYFSDDTDETDIERVIASQYEGHDLGPELTGARLDGDEVDVVTRQSATRTTFTIETGERLIGDHVVELRYSLHDVVYSSFDESTRVTSDLLQWDVLGPEWPHGMASSSATIHVPRELVESYDRKPTAVIAWLLVSGSTSLEPDSETQSTVTYVVENDQNIPPHAQFWFTFSFSSGTFLLPPPSALFWVQVIGPFVPLILLALGLILALAARAVAWSDARGRAWFVYESAPQKDMTPGVAARVWRAVTTARLVEALDAYQRAPLGARHMRSLVKESRRAGRIGHLPTAWAHYVGGRAWAQQFADGLRRIPRGFVRDGFIGAAVGLTIVQWGLVRQLSYQFSLSVFWWPVAVVAASTLLAAVIATLALSARPLTHKGTVAREHLLGLELFALQTRAEHRTTLRDPLLPYVVMFLPARRARALVQRLVHEAGIDAEVHRDPDFIGPGRMAIRVASVMLVAAAIALVIWVPPSTQNRPDDAVYSGDLPGDYGVFVHEYETTGTLVPQDDGRVVLEAEERLSVNVGEGFRDVPQVLRQWNDRVEGHDMRMTVSSVTVDGAAVPYTVGRIQGMALMQTHMPDEWPGEHDVVIRYRLDDAVGASLDGSQWRDQIRWIALNPGWDYGWSGVDDQVERVAIELRVPRAMADDTIGMTGWLDNLHFRELEVADFGRGDVDGDLVVYRSVSEKSFEESELGSWEDLFFDDKDLGAQLQFEEGTFSGPSKVEWIGHAVVQSLAVAAPVALGVLAAGASLAGFLVAFGHPARLRGGVMRDVVRWVPTCATVAQFVLLFWATGDMSGDEPVFLVIIGMLGVSIAASIGAFVMTRRRNSQLSPNAD